VQGHEFSAVVEAIGEGVEGIRVGAKATARPQEVCGECRPCRRGDYRICDSLRVWGFQTDGVGQDLFASEAEKVLLLPESFTHEQGALVEPTAVAVHATSRAGDIAGANVVVLGAGPIGNLVAQMARCRGARVLVTDVSGFRLEKAKECGIDATSNAEQESLAEASKRVFGDDGFDVALDCAGVRPTISAAIDSVSKGGTVVIVAVFQERPPVDLAVIGDRELRVVGTLMYQHSDYEEAIKRIDSGEIATAPLDSSDQGPASFPCERLLGLGDGHVRLDVVPDM
jgi:threonine dehydrogenase-like Zn-dependent dehydrogenase